MSALEASPSNNGRAPEGWSSSWTHLRVKRCRSGYCRVTFDHPPINAINATTVVELAELVGLVEQDRDLNVIVFDTANPDFSLAHYDTERDVRGAGIEFVLACDLRFASRENSSLGRLEVGIGAVPGRGPTAQLSRLVGRGRALENLLVPDDLDGPRAKLYAAAMSAPAAPQVLRL